MLIIDAFNVLHTQGVLPPDLADPGVPGLIRLIAQSRYAPRELTIVCDGGGGSATSGVRLDHAHILYSGVNREADDLIEDLIDRYHRGNPLIVVSSDARLRRAARRRRCDRIASGVFLAHLVEDSVQPTAPRDPAVLRAQVPLDAYSVDRWLDEFGLPPADRSAPTTRVAPATPTTPATLRAARRPKKQPSRPRQKGGQESTLGEPLRLDLPTPIPEPSSDHVPESDSAPTSRPPREPHTPPRRPVEPSPGTTETEADQLSGLDPLLVRALEEWRDRLTIDDLDMQKWIPDATPLPPNRRGGPGSPGGPS